MALACPRPETMNEVPVFLLKPHPKNKEFFPDGLPEALWREMVEDIKENGILNPLIVSPDYTVLAGHLRLEAAKEAGLTHVPVVIRDMAPESDEAVGLLIRDNLLRRQLSDMQVARLIRALKEKYSIKPGKPVNGKHGIEKHDKMSELTKLTGMNERQIQRYDKLNDLIPEIQELVSSGKLGSTAAYELAFLSPETQKQLLAVYGESVSEIKQAEAKELRSKIEAEIKVETEKRINELKQKISVYQQQQKELQVLHGEREADLEKEIADLRERLRESIPPEKAGILQEQLQEKELELAGLRERLADAEKNYNSEILALRKKVKELESQKAPRTEIVERVVEKVVEVPDPGQQARIRELEEQIAGLQKELAGLKDDSLYTEAKKALLKEIRELEAEKNMLDRELNRKRSVVNFTLCVRKLMHQLESSEAEIAVLATQVDLSGTHFVEAQKWIGLLGRYQEHIRTALGIAGKNNVVDVIPFKGRESSK